MPPMARERVERRDHPVLRSRKGRHLAGERQAIRGDARAGLNRHRQPTHARVPQQARNRTAIVSRQPLVQPHRM